MRAYTHQRVMETAQRIKEIAQGAAMMTVPKVDVEFTGGLSELIPNRTLERIAYDKFLKVGPFIYPRGCGVFAKRFIKPS